MAANIKTSLDYAERFWRVKRAISLRSCCMEAVSPADYVAQGLIGRSPEEDQGRHQNVGVEDEPYFSR